MSVAVCAMMKNEAPYVMEWVAHYRILGFNRIIVYENDCSDDTGVILRFLANAGVIDHLVWPSGDQENPQLAAYRDALTRTLDCDWLLFVDTDEFLVLTRHENVRDFMTSFDEQVGCVAINWRIFGSSGRLDAGKGLVIERFLRASERDIKVNRTVKSFVRPKLVKQIWIHWTATDGITASADGTPIEIEGATYSPKVDFTVAQVNHYFTKSRSEYALKAKRGRGPRNPTALDKFTKYTDGMFQFHDRNDIEDDSALKYVPQIRDLVDAWTLQTNERPA